MGRDPRAFENELQTFKMGLLGLCHSHVGERTLNNLQYVLISVLLPRCGRHYTVTDFEIDLRYVMKRSGVKDEKITFIFDESTLNFRIRNPVHHVDEVAGFAIRKAAYRMQNVDMFKLLCETLLGLS